jgi:hypothetical protein
MTSPGTGIVRYSTVLFSRSSKTSLPFWLTTTRPKLISLCSGFKSHTRTPSASFNRGPSQQPIRIRDV